MTPHDHDRKLLQSLTVIGLTIAAVIIASISYATIGSL